MRKLVVQARSLPTQRLAIDQIAELDEPYWFSAGGPEPTPRAIVHHMSLVRSADTRFPIIVCADGRLMDGMHRIVRALLDGEDAVLAKRFEITPQPDFIGVSPDELPYDDG